FHPGAHSGSSRARPGALRSAAVRYRAFAARPAVTHCPAGLPLTAPPIASPGGRLGGGSSSVRCCARHSRPLRWTAWVGAGRDPGGKVRGHGQRWGRAWALDGRPLLGVSVFAAAGIGLDDLLSRRFASFRTIYLPTAGQLGERGFELLPTGQRPHYTVRL